MAAPLDENHLAGLRWLRFTRVDEVEPGKDAHPADTKDEERLEALGYL